MSIEDLWAHALAALPMFKDAPGNTGAHIEVNAWRSGRVSVRATDGDRVTFGAWQGSLRESLVQLCEAAGRPVPPEPEPLPTEDPDITADPTPAPWWAMDVGPVVLADLLAAAGCPPTRLMQVSYTMGEPGDRLQAAMLAAKTWQAMTPTEQRAVTAIWRVYREPGK